MAGVCLSKPEVVISQP